MTPMGQCPLHPDRGAMRTCARCGNFMCEECSAGGHETQCPRCRALTGGGFRFSRTDHDFSRLWEVIVEAFKREWVMLSVAALIVFGAVVALSFVTQIASSVLSLIVGAQSTGAVIAVTVISMGINQFVQGVGYGALLMGYTRMIFDVVQGRPADLARLFSQLPKLGTYLVQFVLVQLLITVPIVMYFGLSLLLAIKLGGYSLPSFAGGTDPDAVLDLFKGVLPVVGGAYLLGIVPMLWVGLPTLLIVPEIVYGNAGAWESITRSFRLASGHRVSIFGYALLGFVLLVVGIFACCVGVLPAFAVFQLLITVKYLALRNGADLPPPHEN
jgi:hypothetical protein